MNLFIIFFMFLLFSCSTPTIDAPTKAEAYYKTWSQDYFTENKLFQTEYQKYLISVEDLFTENQIASKFDTYLFSVNNYFQLRAHAEFNMPFLYKKYKGSRANTNSRDFQVFKNRNLSLQEIKLTNEHLEKLKSDLGMEFFEKLQLNYKKLVPFTAPENKFPL